ncbi:MAG TPA: hypothetical protein VK973_04815 [Arenicellales bacterium]|nr:hypothetical protein [Arenicellales bacterium]
MLAFIEQNALMTQAQLNDARRSIQALFIRSSGEETMLRKLVEILKVNKELHEAFSSIAKISTNVSTSVEIIGRKINYLKQHVSRLQLTPQEHREFFAPFLGFTHKFQEKTVRFNHLMQHYLELREAEAKRVLEYRVAEDASKRLKERLSGQLGTETQGEVEASIRREVLGSFDFANAKQNLAEAERASRITAREIQELLNGMRVMCQLAMNPDMRDQTSNPVAEKHDDIFMLFTRALKRNSRLRQIQDFIIDYFKVYQRAYGMFVIDFDNFNKAVETITNNTDEYFESKKEDEDIRVKREKLRKYEGLIPFLEEASNMVTEYSDYTFTKFSRKISDVISEEDRVWDHISEELLVAKVAAEADLSTRLSIEGQ